MKKINLISELRKLQKLARESSKGESLLYCSKAYSLVKKELDRISISGKLTPDQKVKFAQALGGIKWRFERNLGQELLHPTFDRQGKEIFVSIP